MNNRTASPLVIALVILLMILNGILAFVWLTGIIPRSFAGQRAAQEAESSSAAITAVPAYEKDDTVKEKETVKAEPLLSVAEPLPDLTADDLDNLAGILLERGVLTARDADGSDLSDAVTTRIESAAEDPGQITAYFSMKTPAGKTETAQASFHVDLTAPLLLLKKQEITLSAGEDEPILRDNIMICRDLDGTDLKEATAIGGDYVPHVPGNYTVTYRIYSRVRDALAEKTLLIHVTE